MRHPVRLVARTIIVVLLLTLSACAPVPAQPAPAQPAPTQAPTVTPAALPTAAPPTATPAPATSAPTDSPTAAPTIAPAATDSIEPAPIFGPAWDDREIYRSGLIRSEQAALDALDGASEYRIALEIGATLTAASGQQQVRYTNREDAPLSEVYMRLFPNALGGKMTAFDVTVNGQPIMPEMKFSQTALRVPLPEPLAVGESVVIGLRYDISVPETLETGYGLLSYTDNILTLDAPYAPIPVYNGEGWNVETPPENADTSFNDASLYLVRVTAPAAVTVVATGVAVAAEKIDNATGLWTETTYALGPARDFSLAASSDYTHESRQVGETRVTSYALAGDEMRRDAALAVAAGALESYAAAFGPYPYTEFDMAETPMLALGIEYPGAVGISTRLYAAQGAEGARLATTMESTVAHEIAHQWFYNIVGSDQIDEPWLDESLSQYATWLYLVDRYGEAAAQPWVDSWGARWERADREEKPVGLPAAEYSAKEYSAIVYGRGPLFLAALAERMGQDTFDTFLGDYARAFRWSIATTDDFKQRAEAACACQLDDLYEEWLGR